MTIFENRENIIFSLEQHFGVKFPAPYREFLLNRGFARINGLPVYGLPASGLPESNDIKGLSALFKKLPLVVRATELLRFHRPDLPKTLVAIRLLDVRALCLDLENGTPEDTPLVEVNLKEKNTPPIQVHHSFKEYIEEGERTQQRIKEALEQMRKCRKDAEIREDIKSDHLYGKSPRKAENWRSIRSCVHDVVAGLCNLKYDPLEDALLVAGFVATDHPNYEEGLGVRNLALIVLSDAYKSGSSMKIIFGKAIFDRNEKYRYFHSQEVPEELVKLAQEYGILLKNADKGEILSDEAISLYSELIEIPLEVKKYINKLQGTGLTLQAFCYIIASNIWTKEEAIWLLLNHPRPEGILLGKDLPEDRLFYLESLNYGRAALTISRLRQRILVDLEEKFPKEKEKIYCTVEIREKFLQLKVSHTWTWISDEFEISIEPNQPILVLPRPYSIVNDKIINQKVIKEYFNLLENEKVQNPILIFLVPHFLKKLENFKKISEELKKKNIYLVLPPINSLELDEKVDKKMAQSRLIRK